jgi:hypothetical protein
MTLTPFSPIDHAPAESPFAPIPGGDVPPDYSPFAPIPGEAAPAPVQIPPS